MSLYVLNKCSEEDLSEIERLTKELGLEEQNMICNNRRWSGDILYQEHQITDLKYNLTIIYQPDNEKAQLLIATFPAEINYKNNKLANIIKRLINITKSEIFDGILKPLDIKEFD